MISILDIYKGRINKKDSWYLDGALSGVVPKNKKAMSFQYTSADNELYAVFPVGFPRGIEEDQEDIVEAIFKGEIKYIKRVERKLFRYRTVYYMKHGDKLVETQEMIDEGLLDTVFEPY